MTLEVFNNNNNYFICCRFAA